MRDDVTNVRGDVAIPGYRLEREIARNQRSTLYMGSRNGSGGLVAIRVTRSPANALDSCAWHAAGTDVGRDLDHPNIVRVLDAGRIDGSICYQVTEYVRGGDLGARLAAGLHVRQVLTAIKDVAAALDYAHSHGVCHGDLRPSQLLFDERGHVRVAGFSPAASHGGTKSGHLSPDRAAGAALTPRSDFYSLGVILYGMLSGWSATERGDKSMPVPRLSSDPPLARQFSVFRPILRGLLAQAPRDQFESGLQVAAAVDNIQGVADLPDVVLRCDAVSASEIDAAEIASASDGPATGGDRGTVALLRGPVLWMTVVTAFAFVGSAALISSQGGWERALAFMGLAEHPDVVRAWQAAEGIEADGNQSLNAMVSAYREVLRIAPTHAEATDAIASARETWRSDIAAALDVGDIWVADAKLNELATVFPRDSALTSLFRRLENLRQAQELLADTTRLLARRGLGDARSADAAIASYKEVLRLDPDNGRATRGLSDIAVHHGGVAARLAATDIASARDSLQRALAANPTFSGVATVRAALEEAEGVQEEIDLDLEQAAMMRRRGQLIHPPSANPLHLYRRVLATDPDNQIARQGVSEVSASVLTRFDELLDAGTFDLARDFRDRAAAAGVGDALVSEMALRYDQVLDRIDQAMRLVGEAEALYSKGYITGPDPDENAVALLREALRLEPDNSDAQRLLSVCATRLEEVAREAYRVGLRDEGLHYLDLALTVTPGIARWQAQRERWREELDSAPE